MKNKKMSRYIGIALGGKTKRGKIYLLAAAVLFLSIFLVGVDGVKACETGSDCPDGYFCNDNQTCESSGSYDNTTFSEDSIVESITDNGLTGCLVWPEPTQYCESNYGSSYYCNSNGSCVNSDESGADVTGTTCGDNAYKGRDGSCNCYDGYSKARDGQCYAINENGTMENVTNNSGESGSCDTSESCMFWNCCSSASSVNEISAAEQAAAQKAFNEANSKASAAAATQRAAAAKVDTAYQAQQAACLSGDQAKCAQATTALNNAKDTYDNATADAQSAISEANGYSSVTGSSDGAGFMMCANGIIAPECRDVNGNEISGTLITSGISVGIGGGYGLPYTTGVVGATTVKCGVNFTDVGGICFPTNTGLSSAPIGVILSNIFSWLLGIFTIMAVIAFVISGIQYFMSAGDESLAKSAKQNATNAILGIIVGLSGFIIIRAIAAALSGQGYFF